MASTATAIIWLPRSSLNSLDWCRFCIHLKSLNLHHFKTVETLGQNLRRRSHLQWHDLPDDFYENLPFGLKVISEGHIDWTDRLVIS
jgi:hypothetical protein